MMKTSECLAAVTALLLFCTATVHAVDHKGSEGWNVWFTGEKLESNFTSSEVADSVLDRLQPGDSITFDISLKNGDTEYTDWYMTNEVRRSLEDSKAFAEGGVYTYILTYTDAEGQDITLYSSETVGGESGVGNGLREAAENLGDYFYLDRFAPGASGKISLKVGLDGETQGNAYQSTLAQIWMNFAVEQVLSPEESVPERNAGRQKAYWSSPGRTIDRVQTGDESRILMWSGLAFISGLALAGYTVAFCGRRRRGS